MNKFSEQQVRQISEQQQRPLLFKAKKTFFKQNRESSEPIPDLIHGGSFHPY